LEYLYLSFLVEVFKCSAQQKPATYNGSKKFAQNSNFHVSFLKDLSLSITPLSSDLTLIQKLESGLI